MPSDKLYPGEFEEIILLAIARLGDNAYGVTIRRTVEEVAERPTSIGAVYTTLERLEQKGLISSRQGEKTPERGGRAKRYFRLEATGERALQEADRRRVLLRSRLQPSGST